MITDYFTPDFLQKLKTGTSLNNPVKKTKARLFAERKEIDIFCT
jgi:hypothetical protein